MDLSPIGEEIIGLRGSGLSTEQRKRVTIAVEIVANPVRGRPFFVGRRSLKLFKLEPFLSVFPPSCLCGCLSVYPPGVAVSG
jgi:hypothetical protein